MSCASLPVAFRRICDSSFNLPAPLAPTPSRSPSRAPMHITPQLATGAGNGGNYKIRPSSLPRSPACPPQPSLGQHTLCLFLHPLPFPPKAASFFAAFLLSSPRPPPARRPPNAHQAVWGGTRAWRCRKRAPGKAKPSVVIATHSAHSSLAGLETRGHNGN